MSDNSSPELFRCFFGVLCDQASQHALHQQLITLRPYFPNDELYWMPEDNFHITLRFLGHINQDTIDSLGQICQDLVTALRPFTIHLDQLEWFPKVNKARVLALTGQSIELGQLNAELETIIQAQCLAENRRPFRPHLSLARLRNYHVSPIPEQLPKIVLSMEINRFSLIRSETHPDGAIYQALMSFRFQD